MPEIDVDWVEWGAVGALLALISIGVSIWVFNKTSHQAMLRDVRSPEWRTYFLNILTSGNSLGEKYQSSLKRLAGSFDWYFGRNRLGWGAFYRCVQIAFAYPILLFIAAYAVGGSNEISGVAMYPVPETAWDRLWRAVLLASFIAAVFVWVRFTANFESGLIPHLRAVFGVGQRAERTRVSVIVDGMIIAASIAFSTMCGVLVALLAGGEPEVGVAAIGVSGAVAISGVVAVTVAMLVPERRIGEAAGSAARFVFLAGAGGIAAVAAVAAAITGEAGIGMWAAFYFVLPIANGILDWFSWAVTRWFIGSAMTRRPGWGIPAKALGDLLFAGLCLVLLVALLPILINCTNILLPEDYEIDWIVVAEAARRDPFGEGFMVTGMLLTTLVPTAFHLYAANYALIVVPVMQNDEVIGRYRDAPMDRLIDDPVLLDDVLAELRKRKRPDWLPIAVLVLVMLVFGIAFSWLVPTFADLLYGWSMCAAGNQPGMCGELLDRLAVWR